MHAKSSLLLAVLFAAGCATTGGGSGPVKVARPDGKEAVQLSPRSERRFADAVRAYDDGLKLKVVDWDALARKFQAAIDEDERHAEAHYNLGVIAERRGKPDEAVGHYRRAIGHKPSLKQAYENLAVLLENSGDRAGAEEQYKLILRAYPNDAGARARLAELYLDAGDSESALQLGREALLRDPKNITGHKVIARVHLSRGELALAHLLALRAIEMDDKDAELTYLLGEILEKQGKKEAATAQFRRASQLRADYLPARIRLADEAMRSGDPSRMRNVPSVEEALRAEIGDAEYERYLQATGRPTRVSVRTVLPSSPADRVGLRPGDEIVAYGGKRVFDMDDLNRLTLEGQPGETVVLEVLRDGQPMQLYVPRGPIGISGGGRSRFP